MTVQGSRQESPAFVNLSALLASVSDQALLADPALAALMVEYSCWEMQLADWHDRRLPKRNERFNEWISEGRALFDRRDELKAIAYDRLRGE